MGAMSEWIVNQGDERRMFAHTPSQDVVAQQVLERELVCREHNQAAANMARDMRVREMLRYYPANVHNEADLQDYLEYQALR